MHTVISYEGWIAGPMDAEGSEENGEAGEASAAAEQNMEIPATEFTQEPPQISGVSDNWTSAPDPSELPAAPTSHFSDPEAQVRFPKHGTSHQHTPLLQQPLSLQTLGTRTVLACYSLLWPKCTGMNRRDDTEQSCCLTHGSKSL